ncbi:MAG: hypothetical protein ACP6IP_10460 [Candidatus Njordarchaeia archaeon]
MIFVAFFKVVDGREDLIGHIQMDIITDRFTLDRTLQLEDGLDLGFYTFDDDPHNLVPITRKLIAIVPIYTVENHEILEEVSSWIKEAKKAKSWSEIISKVKKQKGNENDGL